MVVDSVDIGQNGVFPRRNLLGQVDRVRDDGLAFFDWAFHFDFFDLVAEASFGVDKADEAIFDLEDYIGAFFDVFIEHAGGFDGECYATVFVNEN